MNEFYFIFLQCAMLEAGRFSYSAFDIAIIKPLLLATCISCYCAGILNLKSFFTSGDANFKTLKLFFNSTKAGARKMFSVCIRGL